MLHKTLLVCICFFVFLWDSKALAQVSGGVESSVPYEIDHAPKWDELQLGAVIMMLSDWKFRRNDRRCHFNMSMDALTTRWTPHNHYPIILMDTKPWARVDMVAIRNTWPTLDFKFLNIKKYFESVPNIAEEAFEDARNPLSTIAYKRMCHFFFKGFTEVPLLMRYQYLLRMDDDTCIMNHINFDVFRYLRSQGAAYAYSHIWYDRDKHTDRLYNFVDAYVAKHNVTYQNARLHKAATTHKTFPAKVPCYNTNFEVINTLRYRHPQVMHFVNAVAASNMIFHRRWGDAPLRFPMVTMFWAESEVVRLEGFDLQHSSWLVLPMREFPSTSDPI